MVQTIKKFLSKEDGATAIEYAFIAAIVGLGIIPGVSLIAPGFASAMLTVGASL